MSREKETFAPLVIGVRAKRRKRAGKAPKEVDELQSVLDNSMAGLVEPKLCQIAAAHGVLREGQLPLPECMPAGLVFELAGLGRGC